MSKTDFDIIFDKTYKLAETLAQTPIGENPLEKFHIFSNFLSQLIQILNSMDDKSDEVVAQIKNLLDMHKKVILRFENEKSMISDKITNRIRKEHIQQKYHAENLKSALLNKKA